MVELLYVLMNDLPMNVIPGFELQTQHHRIGVYVCIIYNISKPLLCMWSNVCVFVCVDGDRNVCIQSNYGELVTKKDSQTTSHICQVVQYFL